MNILSVVGKHTKDPSQDGKDGRETKNWLCVKEALYGDRKCI